MATPTASSARPSDEFFGSADALRDQMSQAALGVQGSGWGALAWEPLGKKLVVEQVYDHQSNIGNGTVPLLVLDMWEHAFYLQFKNVKGDWVKSFWNIVNWEGRRRALRERRDSSTSSSERSTRTRRPRRSRHRGAAGSFVSTSSPCASRTTTSPRSSRLTRPARV